MRFGNSPVQSLSIGQVKQLQTKLRARGLRVTKIDGIIGKVTRGAGSTTAFEVTLIWHYYRVYSSTIMPHHTLEFSKAINALLNIF
jgi:hypothetical protein